MTSVTTDDIRNALRTVSDGTGGDIVATGRIQGIVVNGGEVGFAIEVDPTRGADAEPLRQACIAAVEKIPGITSVRAVLTAHNQSPAQTTSPPRPSRMRVHSSSDDPAHQSARPAPPPQSQDIPGIDKIIAVASGKGGVGKSTVAVNLALGLARLGLKVGLLDADIYGPSVPQLLGLQGQPESDGKKIVPHEAYGIKAMSIGFIVDEGRAMIWRGPMVMSALTQMLQDVRWGDLDVLVVDMPPGTGDAQLTMAQRVPLAGAVIVSTPQEVALADVRRGIAMFEKTHVPILGLVENMAYFELPTGEKSFIFGQGGVKRTAEQYNVELLGEIPLSTRVRETSDAGQPVVATAPDSAEAAPFLTIAQHVALALGGAAAPAFPRIVTTE